MIGKLDKSYFRGRTGKKSPSRVVSGENERKRNGDSISRSFAIEGNREMGIIVIWRETKIREGF